MGRRNHESQQHQQRKADKPKIVVQLNLKSAERLNKWAKAEQLQQLKGDKSLDQE